MKTGIIDVGGGMRGVYGAGVLDCCMDHDIRFDVCVGVSAGAANLCAYLSGQRGRNYHYYCDYAFRPEYMGWKHYIRERNYINLDYIYGTLANHDGENPLDFPKLVENPAEFIVVTTDAETGRPCYFCKDDMAQDDYTVVKASSSVPIVNRPYPVNGHPYFDGGVSDPVPLPKCLEQGCDRVVVILTRPRDFRREAKTDKYFVKMLRRKYPQMAESLQRRADAYNKGVELALEYERKGIAKVIAPSDIGKMKTLNRSKEDMDALYRKGLKDGEKILDFLDNPH